MNALVAAGVALAVAAVGSTATSFSQLLLRSERTYVQEYGTVAGVDVEVGPGDVRVVAAERTGVVVERTERWSLSRPRTSETVRGDTLQVRADCPKGPSWCDVSYVLRVPPGTRVVAHSRSGSLAASGVGEVQATTQSGDIDLSEVSGVVSAQSGSGNVRADGVHGLSLAVRSGSGDVTVRGASTTRVIARTGSGDVALELVEPADDVLAQTGSGDVDVALPQTDDLYAVSVDTGSGDSDVGVRTDPRARPTVVVRTGSGDARVRYVGAR